MAFLIAALIQTEWTLADDAAVVSGTVTFEGAVPEAKRVDVGADAAAKKAHPDGLLIQRIMVDKDKGLANCIVYVKSGLEKFTFKAVDESAVVKYKDYALTPAVFVVRKGQKLRLGNADDTCHNHHVSPKNNKGINVLLQGGKVAEAVFDAEEIGLVFKCD